MIPRQRNLHPARKGKWIRIVTVAGLLAMAGGYAYYSRSTAPSPSAGRSQTQTEVVRRGDLVLSAGGTATLIARADAAFGFETAGQVTGVHVKVGD